MMMVGDSVERMDAGCFPPRGVLFLVSFLNYYPYTTLVTALLTTLMSCVHRLRHVSEAIKVLIDFFKVG